MWIDKTTLDWNPWDTDPFGKKRPCHIEGLRQMNKYHLQKRQEKQQQQQSSAGGGGKMNFVKIAYKDPDMQQLATQNKGTTDAYNYS